MKKASTYIFSVILTLLLTFSVIATTGLMLMKFRAFSAGNCLQLMQSQNLASRVHQSLESYYKAQENTSGIPAEVYADSITEAQAEKLIRMSISNAFDYLNGKADSIGIEPDFSELEADMTAFFSDYAAKNNYEKDAAYEETLAKSISAAETTIRTQCDVFRFETLADAGLLAKAKTVMPWIGRGLIAAIIADLLLLLLLLAVNRKEKENTWYWLGNALLISSLLMLIPSVWLTVQKWFDKFAVKTDQIFAAVTGYLYGLTHSVITVSIVGIVLAFCCYLFFVMQRRVRNARTNGT